MSSTSDQFFGVDNLRMLDRILRKAGFRGGETHAADDGEITATSFLISCFQMGVVDEAALRSSLKMYLATQLSSGPLPQAMEDASFARWQDDGGAPVKAYRIARYTASGRADVSLRPPAYRFPKTRLPERLSEIP
ncbi:hypothetical protein ELI13_04965 [Rhizobium ruizarguesonis]|jgi:hypothetical protein|uniref:Uncharacterized protein n=1 Tax=Rhizobium ruizarguesonis TaxID=2081791 RepID=A0AAE4YS97_9HYPH|nr:hypothetical protein [Rhizobium ruizarguesonis]MBY5846136.1 hypothetical protein [Rhizobium leguminosarum]NKK59782.1 hypothetical protein [Rhizobium leguminosarum bv. viciae]QIO44474.1 hypothetical protein HA464_10940 [Rhizobium leguminosarum bv. trifolii]MBY5852490.1 hypothetical protein [Rhizobium leguminosarum]MBY5897920.1 hypothetical protein [Rhizobium leguminosarum]